VVVVVDVVVVAGVVVVDATTVVDVSSVTDVAVPHADRTINRRGSSVAESYDEFTPEPRSFSGAQ
jgi:hypothetical protein